MLGQELLLEMEGFVELEFSLFLSCFGGCLCRVMGEVGLRGMLLAQHPSGRRWGCNAEAWG